MDLDGKKAIVTGGASGIGRSVVDLLLDEGTQVGVLDINGEGLAGLEEECPSVSTFECDLTDHHQVELAVGRLFDRFGAIDVLVNNAGLLYSSPLVRFSPNSIEKHDVSMWNKVLATNLSSTFYATANVAQGMLRNRTKGVIVNVSSISAGGNRGQTAYAAAKAGVNALTATWAKELSPLGIRVAGVAPGFTDTESTHRVLSPEIISQVRTEIPLRRLGRVEEIAAGIVFVIKNDFFNGKVLELDGGMTL